jgi:hypothetical protein
MTYSFCYYKVSVKSGICSVMYSTVQYCTVLYCTVLYSNSSPPSLPISPPLLIWPFNSFNPFNDPPKTPPYFPMRSTCLKVRSQSNPFFLQKHILHPIPFLPFSYIVILPRVHHFVVNTNVVLISPILLP